MIRRAKSLLALTLLVFTAAAFTAGPVLAVTPAPHWTISSSASPTHFAPDDNSGNSVYTIIVTNTGGADSDGSPITITDNLPPGLTANPLGGHGFVPIHFSTTTPGSSADGPCEIGPPVKCTINAAVHPGHQIVAFIPVNVAAPAVEGTVVENHVSVSGGGAAETAASEQTLVSSDPAGLGFQDMETWLTDAAGGPVTQAGSHPYQLHFGFQLNTNSLGDANVPAATPRYIRAKLPPGVVVNPNATPVRCTEAEFETHGNGPIDNCPAASAVGIVHTTIGQLGSANPALTQPLYNMVTPPGAPAMLAYNAAGFGIFIHLRGGTDTAGDYALTAEANDAPQYGKVSGVRVDLWGNPSDPSHDNRRGYCSLDSYSVTDQACPVPATDTPLLTMPSACSGPIEASVSVASWEDPANPISESAPTQDSDGNPVGVTGCSALEFEPSLQARPTTNVADSPSGLDVDLQVPQTNSMETLATANLKKAEVTLPEGLVVNPSGANGLDACSSSQIGLTTPIGSTPVHFTAASPSCPDAAKIGSVEVETPLLADPLPGSLYIARPHDNPFGSFLALYIVVDDPQTGIVVKLAGRVSADPQTGRLSTTFDENPQLPVSELRLNLKAGAHAPLRTPATCGEYSTTSLLSPWSGTAPVPLTDTYAISQAPGVGACAASPSDQPHAPSFDGGSVSPVAAAYSPFVVHLRREDGSQQFSAVTVRPPGGLVAKLAGTAICSDAELAAAAAKSGNAEKASPSCPAASRVGSVNVAAGAGPDPYNARGIAYLTGPYKGAPLSLAIVTPATAGPFDLGTVVVRTALQVDPKTAEITAVSDPLPTILEGIPLDVRSADIAFDKPDFTRNGTSCDPGVVGGQLTSTLGQAASLSSRFQLAECNRLGFEPQMTLRLKGGTKRGKHPALSVVLKPRPGDAGIASVSLAMPKSEFLDQAHIRTICTRVQFAADTCPSAAIYGEAKVKTQLLDYPLTGHVYLRSSENKLPDVVPDLRGPSYQPIRLETAGRTDSVKGAIRNTFDFVPDAPFTETVVALQGGAKGLLVNSRDICAKTYRATVKYTAHNGDSYVAHPKLVAQCGKSARKQGKKSRRSARAER